MKRPLAFVATAGMLVAGAVFAQSASSPAEQAIRPLMAKMRAAAYAHDADAFMAFFQKSPNLMFAIDGRIIRGWDALRAQQLTWWKNGKSDVVYTATVAPVFDTLAPGTVLVTQQMSSRRTGTGGKPSLGTFVVTSIWKHLPEGWRIVYGHESWARPPG